MTNQTAEAVAQLGEYLNDYGIVVGALLQGLATFKGPLPKSWEEASLEQQDALVEIVGQAIMRPVCELFDLTGDMVDSLNSQLQEARSVQGVAYVAGSILPALLLQYGDTFVDRESAVEEAVRLARRLQKAAHELPEEVDDGDVQSIEEEN